MPKTITCEHCGKQSKKASHNAKYCSAACNSAAYRVRHPGRQATAHAKWYTAHREIHLEKRRKWRRLNPEKVRIKSREDRLRRYGISIREYEERYRQQNGKCLGCDRHKPMHGREGLVPDHNHLTGEVRGLLCNHCNMIVGILETKEKEISRLAQYLRQSQP